MRPHYFVNAVSLYLLIILLWSCSPIPQRATVSGELDALPPALLPAQLLYKDRQPQRAMALINEILQKNDLDQVERSAAHTLLANIHFSLQEFELAREHFARANSIMPGDYTALHRSWSATLMASPDNATKTRIRAEIEKLAHDPGTGAGGLLAAYQGFAYLWDGDGAKSVMTRLMEVPLTPDVDKDMPYLLMQEMMAAESVQESIAYTRYFLAHYPGHINLPTLLSILFYRPLPVKYVTMLRDEFATNTYIPYLEYYLARYALEKMQDTQAAYKRSLDLVNRIEANRLPDCAKDKNLVNCAYFRNRLISISFRLYAKLLAGRQRTELALQYARKATQVFPESGRAWFYLAKLLYELDRGDEAEQALTQALNLRPDLQAPLDLFDTQHGTNTQSRGVVKRKQARRQQVPYFEDVTAAAELTGIKAQWVAWGDVDGDGYDDLLLDGSKLLLNKSGRTFSDISRQAGLAGDVKFSGGLFIDYDNDGLLDILSVGVKTVLYRNNGSLRFSVIEEFNGGVSRRTAAAGWGDFNNDGYADLYLANYERPASERGICDHDQLFINARGKSFTDHSELPNALDPYRQCSRGVVWSDLDLDGKQEIIISSYRLLANHLYVRKDDNTLADIAYTSRFQGSVNGHSIAAVTGDFNSDGRIDIYQTNLAHPRFLQFSDTSHLFLNQGNSPALGFSIAEKTGISFNETDADISAADFNNDGHLDLFITSIYRKRYSALYLNDGAGHFRNVSWVSNTQVGNGWGTASADFDNDGDSDILVASKDGVHLLKNEADNHNSLTVSVASKTCQRNGIGMKLWLTRQGQTDLREIQAGKGTGTQDSASIIFGLGDYHGSIELRGLDSCGNEYRWSGNSDVKRIQPPVDNGQGG